MGRLQRAGRFSSFLPGSGGARFRFLENSPRVGKKSVTLPEIQTNVTWSMAMQQTSGEQPLVRSDRFLPGSVPQQEVAASSAFRAADSTGRPVAVSAGEVFGEENRFNTTLAVEGTPQRREAREELNLLLLNGILAGLFMAYAVLIFLYRSQAFILVKAALVKGFLNHIVEEQSLTFRFFLTAFNAMGIVTLLALFVKAYLLVVAANGVPEALTERTQLLVPLLLGAIVSVWLYQGVVHGVMAKLSTQSYLIAQIRLFNRIHFALFSLIVTPLAVLFGLTAGESGGNGMRGFATVLIVLILYYIFKSFSFFIERKISILQWFLYLCAVEIWPVSFYVLFAMRDFQL